MTDTVHYIETEAELARAVKRMHGAAALAVDTESDSLHSYFEKVCFIQVKAGRDIYLIDTIRLRRIEPLRELFEDEGLVKFVHGADYDVVCLKRDFEVHFAGLYCTMVASQFLDRQRLGLAALCEEFFGVQLDKSLTKHDWARRPLSERHLEYICQDVRHLVDLGRILQDEVAEAGIAEEVDLEFERIRGLEWTGGRFDPDSYTKIKGSADLDPQETVILKSLYVAREEIARELDVPPFKVMNPSTLLDLAKRRPRRPDQLAGVRGVSARVGRTYGSRIVAAVQDALEGRVEPAPRRKTRRPRNESSGCREALREWRKKAAARRGCPTVVVLPNHVIDEILIKMPATVEELAGLAFLGSRRLSEHGRDILNIIDRYRPT